MPSSDSTPGFMRRAFHFIQSILQRLSKLFDRVVYNRKSSLIVSFILAVIICVSVNYEDLNYRFFNTDEKVLNLTNVPVNATYDTEAYVVEGLPDAVAVTLSGSPADITLYQNQYHAEVSADLRNLSTGENVVELKTSGIPSGVSATVNPSSVSVKIVKKITRDFTVTPELIIGQGQSAGEFTVSGVSNKTVQIKATKEQLDSIRLVRALADTSGKTGSFEISAPLVAYDSSGTPVNVTIIPETVTVSVAYNEKDADSQKADDNAKTESDETN